MGEIQLGSATSQKLSKGPRTMDRTRFSGGKTEYGSASCVDFSPKPVPLQYDNTGIKGGKIDKDGGTSIPPIDRTPRKGWDSYPTPLSNRAMDQGKGGGK